MEICDVIVCNDGILQFSKMTHALTRSTNADSSAAAVSIMQKKQADGRERKVGRPFKKEVYGKKLQFTIRCTVNTEC